MTVTINTLGANSRQIVINAETSATNIINAVNTSLTALGWTLIDTVTSGSRGLLTTKVYSAPNADTVTTKYLIVRYDLHRQYWFVSCAENWNTTTNVATNESWYGGRNILLPLQYSNTVLYVFATARYAAFMGVVNGEPGPWQGVFEFEREAAEDILNQDVPCFAWTSSLTIGEPFGNFVVPTGSVPTSGATSANNGFVSVGLAPPRTANGLTGANAANNFAILTGLGQYPPSEGVIVTDYNSGGITQTMNSHCGMLGGFNEGNGSYVWNNNKTVISNIKVAGYASAYIAGKIYGLKITVKLGAPLATVVIPVDANLFYDAAGTNLNHALLGIHGGYKDKLVAGANRLASSVYNSNTAMGQIYQSVLVSGRFIYFTTATGFHKFDALNLSFTLNVLPAGTFFAVKFDGENSLYVTTGTTNVYKLNLTNDSYSTYNSGVAVSGIALDDDFLYACSNNTTGTTVTIKKVQLSTFTESAAYSITITSGYWVTHTSTADYSGYLYIGVIQALNQSNNRVYRMATNDGTSSFVTLAGGSSQNIAQGAQPLFFDGSFLYFSFATNGSGSPSTLQHIIHKVNISNFTYTANIPISAAYASPNMNYLNGNSVHGCIEVPSFAGMQIYTINSSSTTIKIPFSDPRIPNGIANVPGDANTYDSTNTVQMGQHATDQCSLYCFNTTQIIRYQGAFRNYNFNGVQTSNMLIPQ